ncbi:MAG: hypothetical protein AAF628_37860, partial [Planctomycetota bacterium]
PQRHDQPHVRPDPPGGGGGDDHAGDADDSSVDDIDGDADDSSVDDIDGDGSDASPDGSPGPPSAAESDPDDDAEHLRAMAAAERARRLTRARMAAPVPTSRTRATTAAPTTGVAHPPAPDEGPLWTIVTRARSRAAARIGRPPPF